MCVIDTDVTALDILIGQSNAEGGSKSVGGPWPVNANVYVWNQNFNSANIIGDGADTLSAGSRGVEPFGAPVPGNPDGANNFGAHMVDRLQKRSGEKSVLLLHTKGGEPIGSFLPGGDIWTSLVANVAVLLAKFPNAALRSVTMHHGESAQADTTDWYIGKLLDLVSAFRAQAWCPADTPFIFGQIYCGAKSSTRHWFQNYALAELPNLDDHIGLVSSHGLDVLDEGFTDSYGAPYGIHFDAESLATLGVRYANAVLAKIEGHHVPATFDLRKSMGGTQLGDVITVAAGGSRVITLTELANEPVIKCMGSANIYLPDIASTALSSWVRNYPWCFTLFRNGASGNVNLHTGSAHTIAVGDASASTTATINDRAIRRFLYTKDTRFRG